MKTTNTDLRAEFDNMFYFDTGYRGERIEALNNDTETLWNWIQANHISRKDAVSKSEVSRKINELSVDRDGWVKEHIEDLEILLTEVDKPNKS